MRPGRRRLLQAVGAVGSAAAAGCLGTVDSLFDGGDDHPGYTRWLPAPGTVVPASRYRFGAVRPTALTDPTRARRLLPGLAGTGVDPTTVDRVVAGNGAFAVSGDVEQSAVVAALRDAGYAYVAGVGNAWVMAPTDGSTPVYAVDDGRLVEAYPVADLDARSVATTVMTAGDPTPHWTRDIPALTAVTDTLGDPPVLVAALHDRRRETIPAHGRFADTVAWAIADSPTGVQIAIVATDATTAPVDAVETWATRVFETATVTTRGRVITVDAPRPPRVWTLLPAVEGSWPTPGADPGHTGTVSDTRPPTPPVTPRWVTSLDVGGRVTGPVTDTDRTYVGVGDLVAVDAATGDTAWRTPGPVTGTPTIADGAVFASTATGVMAVDAATGDLRWQRPLTDPVLTPPVVADGTVYVGVTVPDGGGAVTALDAGDGRPRWHRPTGAVQVTPTVVDGTVFAADRTGTVHAFAADGSPRWTAAVPGSPSGHAVAGGEHLYVPTGDALHALPRTGGPPAWQVEFDARYVSPPATVGDLVVVGESRPGASDAGALTVFAGDGTRRYSRPLERAVVGQPAIAGDAVHLVGAAGTIGAYALADGRQRWRHLVVGTLNAPTVVDDHLVLTTVDGRLASLTIDWLPHPPDRFTV